jgi:hypothetical protein
MTVSDDRSAPSRRCTTCAINWPAEEDFEHCPQCGEKTWASVNEVTVDAGEIAEAKFERYLRQREQADRDLLERVEPWAFAQYLMDAAEEQWSR